MLDYWNSLTHAERQHKMTEKHAQQTDGKDNELLEENTRMTTPNSLNFEQSQSSSDKLKILD